MQLPGLKKSLNIGMGAASQNNKLMEEAVAELTAIAIVKAVVTVPKSPSPPSNCAKGCPSARA